MRLIDLFRNPVSERAYCDGVYNLFFDRPLVCFNLFHVLRELNRIPPDAQAAYLHLRQNVTLIDHTTLETLGHYMDEFNSRPRGFRLGLMGLEQTRPLSMHKNGMRLRVPQVVGGV